ncbi:restriction endonuclease subunit S [Niallia oryzisoli]|uniref:Restriction endonuclease subunit S n=1 Tax=Niallia oryzisoli TaxID=1737571 RepID=A0ABZ2CMV0_9BACI
MEKVNLSNLIKTLESGSRPKGGVSDNGIPSLGGEHISKENLYKFDKVKYIPEDYFNNLKKGMIEKEDILIVKDGATTGRVAFIDESFPFEKSAINEHLFKLSVDSEKILPKYLYYYLVSNKGNNEMMKDFRGATVGGITKKFIDFVNVPVPSSKGVQYKILDILDKSQNLIYQRNAQIDALDRLTQSAFLEIFGDPVQNSKNWVSVTLEELGEWKSGGTPSRSNKEYFKGNIPWLSAGELNDIYSYSSNEYITEEALKNSAAKIIPVGSLLLGMYDTAALKSTINQVECSCNQAVAFAKLDESIVSTIFVYYCIQIGKEHYRRLQRGVRQKNLNLTMIKNISIICPPIELQRKFSNTIDVILEQRSHMEKGLIELENNFDSIMQRAFNGQLFIDEKVSNL